jgi:group I intron endonuclease
MKDTKYYFYNALNKYGVENFTWETIDSASTLEELNKKEEYWIKNYQSFDDGFGYNMDLGGTNRWAEVHKFTDKERDNLSLLNGGNWFVIYDTNGNYIGRYLNVKRYCEENNITQSHFSSCLLGNRASVKGMIPIYESELDEELLWSRIKRVQPKNHNIFRVIDDNGNLIGEFDNKLKVAQMLNFPPSKITDCLNGRRKHYNKYKFEYV